jgi:signal transduction histidine kinase
MESRTSAATAERPHGLTIWIPRLVLGLTVVGVVAAGVRGFVDTADGSVIGWLGDVMFAIAFGSFAVVGYVLATRLPSNPIGWICLATGGAVGLDAILTTYATYALHGGPGGHDAAAFMVALDSPMWVPLVTLPTTFLLLLFPDGRLPSPRWRRFAWAVGVGLVLVVLLIFLSPGPLTDSGFPQLRNPFGIEAVGPFVNGASALILVIPVAVVTSLVGLVLRYRSATGLLRVQLRWLVTTAVTVAIVYAIVFLLSINTDWGGIRTPAWLEALQNLAVAAFVLIPVSVGVAVLRHRLYDIDLVINRAVLFASLGVFITAVYVAIVVGVGTLVGSRTEPALSAAAAAVVALAFQPARRRAQHFADRLVYGKRATPYEVLSEFSDRLGTAYAADDLLPRMARTLAEGTGAARADVFVRVGDELRPEAAWPVDAELPPALAIGDPGHDSPTQLGTSGASVLELVRHQGEMLGALSITKKPGEPVTPTEERLVRDLAAQAGLVLRNVRLIEELRASRQRLVSAGDAERRKIERNLHDGAQQQLVALAVQLKLLGGLAERDAARATDLAATLQHAATDALESLRDLARGIYPPVLADKGLVAALESQAQKAAIPVSVEASAIERYPQDVEAAVYFCSLEALQNAAKYAEASAAVVRVAQNDGSLTFEVADDGKGFDAAATKYGTGLQGMADRLSAMGGSIRVRSTPGAGTTVVGEIPVKSHRRRADEAG